MGTSENSRQKTTNSRRKEQSVLRGKSPSQAEGIVLGRGISKARGSEMCRAQGEVNLISLSKPERTGPTKGRNHEGPLTREVVHDADEG